MPKGPAVAAKEFPIATVKNGKDKQTKWYVGEMSTSGGVKKCWKMFKFILHWPNFGGLSTAAGRAQWEACAWGLVQNERRWRGWGAGGLTPEEDKKAMKEAEAARLKKTGRKKKKCLSRRAKHDRAVKKQQEEGARAFWGMFLGGGGVENMGAVVEQDASMEEVGGVGAMKDVNEV